jgi:hypothetical protein
MFAIEPNDKTIFILPIGYGVIVFGLVAFTVGTFGPMVGADVGRGIQFAIFAGMVIGLLEYHGLVKAYRVRWHEANEMLIARMRRTTAQYTAEADRLSTSPATTAEDDDTAGDTDATDDASYIHINTPQGSYYQARMTEAERLEQIEIGQGIRFVNIGIKAGKFSCRGMTPFRPPGWSETKFEKWWTDRSDALVKWGLFEKEDRGATKPAGGRTPDEVRRALLRRDFPASQQTALPTGQTGQGQTA